MTRLTLRIDFDDGQALGPGKVRLLEEVAAKGSIRAAAAAMKMSYRRAWLLLKAVEETFGAPVISAVTGGESGGGAQLNALGEHVVRLYRLAEGRARGGSQSSLAALMRLRQNRKGKKKPR